MAICRYVGNRVDGNCGGKPFHDKALYFSNFSTLRIDYLSTTYDVVVVVVGGDLNLMKYFYEMLLPYSVFLSSLILIFLKDKAYYTYKPPKKFCNIINYNIQISLILFFKKKIIFTQSQIELICWYW